MLKEDDERRTGNELEVQEVLKHEDVVRSVKTQQWLGHLVSDIAAKQNSEHTRGCLLYTSRCV